MSDGILNVRSRSRDMDVGKPFLSGLSVKGEAVLEASRESVGSSVYEKFVRNILSGFKSLNRGTVILAGR